MTDATIIGLDTSAGAYLARLLVARGYAVGGTARDPAAAGSLLATLGADGVRLFAAPRAADEVYRLDASVAVDALAGRRLLVALPPQDGMTVPPQGAAGSGAAAAGDAPADTAARDAAAVAARRAAGEFAVAATVHDHASRLDPAHWANRLCAAARDGGAAEAAAEDPPRDLGWTPEYVDALWRLLQAPAPADAAVASGVGLSRAAVWHYAAEYFGGPAAAAAETPMPPPPGPPGWRAFTHGRDLVRTLCEGLGA